jgi:hypothetical protein
MLSVWEKRQENCSFEYTKNVGKTKQEYRYRKTGKKTVALSTQKWRETKQEYRKNGGKTKQEYKKNGRERNKSTEKMAGKQNKKTGKMAGKLIPRVQEKWWENETKVQEKRQENCSSEYTKNVGKSKQK